MKIKLDIKIPSFNEYQSKCRSHWSKGAKMKKDYEQIIIHQLPKLAIEFYPCKLKITYFEKDKRRDVSNVNGFGEKIILDAMVRKGILKDDGQKYHVGTTYEVKQSHEWAVEIEILEV